MSAHPLCRAQRRRDIGAGFTLVELLVVIGIIAVLMGLLLPVLSQARRQARFTRCAANISQICVALHNYATDYKGVFPPNVDSPNPGMYWCDGDRIGSYIAGTEQLGQGVGGSVLACPEDEGAKRSYAMNAYASSRLDGTAARFVAAENQWSAVVRKSSQMLLIVESWSGQGASSSGYYANPIAGWAGSSAGQRFGAGGGITPAFAEGRFGSQPTELPFSRHPFGGFSATISQSTLRGRLNFGYADGHVSARSATDLADFTVGITTGDSLWSLADLPTQ